MPSQAIDREPGTSNIILNGVFADMVHIGLGSPDDDLPFDFLA